MSIIQDALKRKSDDPPARGAIRFAQKPASRAVATKTPAPPSTVMILLTVLILLVVLAGALAAAFFLLWNQSATPPEPAVTVQPGTPPGAPSVAPLALPEPDTAPLETTPQPQPPIKPQVDVPQPTEQPTGAILEWPELRITGIAVLDDRRLVWINDRMLGEGRTIDGVRIVEIRPREVVLDFQGETRTIDLSE